MTVLVADHTVVIPSVWSIYVVIAESTVIVTTGWNITVIVISGRIAIVPFKGT